MFSIAGISGATFFLSFSSCCCISSFSCSKATIDGFISCSSCSSCNSSSDTVGFIGVIIVSSSNSSVSKISGSSCFFSFSLFINSSID